MADTSDQVLKWLREQGYPFELRVARELRRAGWRPEHATWYRDPETGKPRELDLVAELERSTDTPEHRSAPVRLAIECKASSNAWVIFVGSLPGRPFSMSGMTDHAFSRPAVYSMTLEAKSATDLLAVPEYYGHGIVKVHSNNKQGDPTAPYAAIRSVLSAAHVLGAKLRDWSLAIELVIPTVGVIIPVVVLDGNLFSYSIESGDIEQLRQVDRAVVAIASPITGHLAAVHIVTHGGLAAFLSDVTPQASHFAQRLLERAPAIVEAMKKPPRP